MNDIKELAKWLKDEVEFLKANQDYVGGWYDLGNGLAATVLWEDGWGDEARDDAIQSEANPDWALCAGVMVINKDDTPDGWFMPWDSKTGDLLCETTGITPNEDYDKLASWLLDDFNRLKGADIKSNGETIFGEPEREPEAPVETPVEVEEESLNEAMSKGEQIAKVIAKAFKGQCGPMSGEDPYLEGNKVTLHSQGPDESWIFNDDGSVDNAETEDEFIDSAYPDDYDCEDEEELRAYFNEIKHFDSVRDLFNSGLSWFTGVWDDEEKILAKIDAILGSKKESCEDCHEECEKPIKESPYHDIIAEYFDYNGDFEFLDIVASVLGRISNFEDDEDIYQSLDDELIYTYDQWKVLEHYCTPQEANWDSAYSDFMNDVFAICSRIAGTNNNEDDLEEPEEGEDDD